MDSRLAHQIGGIIRHQLVEFVRQNLRDADSGLNHPIPGVQLPVGFPLRSCQAYARKAQVVIPTLEDYERKLAAAENVIVPMPAVVA